MVVDHRVKAAEEVIESCRRALENIGVEVPKLQSVVIAGQRVEAPDLAWRIEVARDMLMQYYNSYGKEDDDE